ncbi:MAG TPA: hypothetical protein PK637_00260 [Flavobacteriales bacterium]|nr:hypothetical protein [Flavobacteriales bacterium]HRE74128.1 hypothetical protein [Flavobacteriales bacterium]HRE95163.1 hypothetical protein [Flavobacteriales bacterium]HRJ35299.1 hypothetical protein [Flavobacteriales bacterium]HRJ39423.1 hypothetical protein [Flavobacteriales bacterium]
MNRIILISLGLLMITSCGTSSEKSDQVNDNSTTTSNAKKYDTRQLEGMYMGQFGKATLMLQINYVKGKNASGFNILRGNRRNIKGTVENKGDRYFFILDEPGNDKYDGKFEFEIDTTQYNLVGKWIPNDPKSAQLREFTLKRVEQKDADPNIVGDWQAGLWSVHGIMTFKKDGTLVFDGYNYNEESSESENVRVNGTWLEDGEIIRLEIGKHPLLKKQLIELKKASEEGFGDMFLLKSGEDVTLYPYGMYF